MKRIISILLVLAVMAGALTGCGGSGNPDGNAPGKDTPAATPAPTPEPTPEPYEPNVLTGYEKNLDYPEGQRITAVMVNNIATCRPQKGLSDAQILFEIKVEGGITRFMGLFNDYNKIQDIGPIRSARDQFFQLVLPFQPLYAHIGQSVVQKQYIADFDYDEWNLEGNFDGKLYFRNKNRVNWAGNHVDTEHTAYMNGERIADYIARHEVDDRRAYNSTFFNFVDYRDPAYIPEGKFLEEGMSPVADRVTIRHSQSYRTRFDYDDTLGQYKMSQFYSKKGGYMDTIDENNGKQLTFDNLIILFTDIHTYPGHEKKDLQEVVYDWGGVGFYCYGGKIERIRWEKGTPLEALRLVTFDTQEPLKINCGTSYVTVVDQDEIPGFKWETDETKVETSEAPVEETFVESDD